MIIGKLSKSVIQFTWLSGAHDLQIRPVALAAACVFATSALALGLRGLTSRPYDAVFAENSPSSPNCLVTSESAKPLIPVKLPSGLLRFVTKPRSIALPPVKKRLG